MGFIKEVYSDNRAGLVVAFGHQPSESYFDGNNIEDAIEYFHMYLNNDVLYVKTEDEQALEAIGIQSEDAVAVRSALDIMLATVPDENVKNVAILFPLWKENTEYVVNQRVRYINKVYKVLQNHTSQTDWTPDRAVCLFACLLIDEENGEILDWVQPDSTNAYMTGDKVKYEGLIYESLIDNNIWSPVEYPTGWVVVPE